MASHTRKHDTASGIHHEAGRTCAPAAATANTMAAPRPTSLTSVPAFPTRARKRESNKAKKRPRTAASLSALHALSCKGAYDAFYGVSGRFGRIHGRRATLTKHNALTAFF